MYTCVCVCVCVSVCLCVCVTHQHLVHHSNDDNEEQMSAGKFYKMVRECQLLDGLVTQEKVASLFKEVMKTGKGGATHIEYADYIQALAMLSQIKFENCDGPIQVRVEH